MKQFKLTPKISQFNRCSDFCQTMNIGSKDLLIVSEHTYNDYLSELNLEAHVVFLRNYGQGEPSDLMVEAICNDLAEVTYDRVIAIGGGTILDVAKLFVLDEIQPVCDLFMQKLPIKKVKELILVPTTCGTGSEVTNISILELTQLSTKKGLAVDALYADHAILITEFLYGLPYKYFATSSIDAFIHSIESYLSPKATPISELFSEKAMGLILEGYKQIAEKGEQARMDWLDEFLLASTYAGIAFGNAGCAAVHALSYPLGATFHVPHGESNYAILGGVFAEYERLNPHGKFKDLCNFIAVILECHPEDAMVELDMLLAKILPKKALKHYGVKEMHLSDFTESVMVNQGRLMANNYVALDSESVRRIYDSLYD